MLNTKLNKLTNSFPVKSDQRKLEMKNKLNIILNQNTAVNTNLLSQNNQFQINDIYKEPGFGYPKLY